jgi:hypothetical protein
MFAIYSKHQNVVRVHYSHLTEQQADDEVERLNWSCPLFTGQNSITLIVSLFFNEHLPCILWPQTS